MGANVAVLEQSGILQTNFQPQDFPPALAVNDGFENWEQMKLWFDNSDDRQFIGKIIFWKDCTWL